MRGIVVGFLLVTLSACGGGNAEDDGPSDSAIISIAMQDVRGRLKDPGSAEFSAMKVSRRGGATVVCGYVNAKNSFGGMTGPERFIAGGIVTGLESDFEPGGLDQSWNAFC